ncbi:transposase [Nonomuraea endophytica]|uniref:Transposase n=1 Tax=Nonomuraea endophytica TaxID=714136 RepID=A0A7W8ELC0_9ACTN|nr:transposase [Nonomuraea endophytica]MBB5085150.1 transposase [Nonomuraea endophytica]
MEIVTRSPADQGFIPQPKRWIVEQTYGTLMLHRCLVRDYEHLPASSESRVYWAMTDVMSRRLTRAPAPSSRTT